MSRYLIILLFFISSCQLLTNSNLDQKEIEFKEKHNINCEVFKNIYVAFDKKCKKRKLPITQFKIEYPDNLYVITPNDKSNHIIIQKKKNGVVMEEIAISQSSLKSLKEARSYKVLDGWADAMRQVSTGLTEYRTGVYHFNGESTYLTEYSMDMSKMGNPSYTGRYRILLFFPFTKKNKDLNAVTITFLARYNSEIQSSDDFETKGMIADVWKTFKYIE